MTMVRAAKNFASSPEFFRMVIMVIAMAIISYIGLYGKDKFFPKERGESLEKEHILLAQKVDKQDEIAVIEMRHLKESVDELKGLIKEYLRNRDA